MIDALMLLGQNRFGPPLLVEDALELAFRLGVDRVVAAPARPMDYHLEPANETLAERARSSDGRLIALGRVDPLDGDRAIREARHCVRDLGCVGLFLHPGEEAYPVRDALPVIEVAAELKVPVVVAAGIASMSEPLQVARLASACSTIPFVMSTGGQLDIAGLALADVWLALTTTPNLHVLTNGVYRRDFIERLASQLDPRRILFASMAPVFDVAYEVARIRSARLASESRRLIEHDNALRLFGP